MWLGGEQDKVKGGGGRLSEGKGSGDIRTDSEILSSGQPRVCVHVCG